MPSVSTPSRPVPCARLSTLYLTNKQRLSLPSNNASSVPPGFAERTRALTLPGNDDANVKRYSRRSASLKDESAKPSANLTYPVPIAPPTSPANPASLSRTRRFRHHLTSQRINAPFRLKTPPPHGLLTSPPPPASPNASAATSTSLTSFHALSTSFPPYTHTHSRVHQPTNSAPPSPRLLDAAVICEADADAVQTYSEVNTGPPPPYLDPYRLRTGCQRSIPTSRTPPPYPRVPLSRHPQSGNPPPRFNPFALHHAAPARRSPPQPPTTPSPLPSSTVNTVNVRNVAPPTRSEMR
ncbi:hypothetical protein R3P38DRAFT_3187005 [Favolaschia claudopus]|uniref:Uncharacterized protein n=1 Tax=Favolaschia claudopus TaxID=2862362 RepID=A0AAW0C3A8_9AGAR